MGYPTNVVVTGPISVSGIADTYPTHWAELGKGGLAAVSTFASLSTIPTDRREFGMFRAVIADPTPANNGVYMLANIALGGSSDTITDNSNWIPFTSGGGSGSTSFTLETFTATASQTTFTCTGGTIDQISFVMVNGHFQNATHYSRSGNDIVFSPGLPVSTRVDVGYFEDLSIAPALPDGDYGDITISGVGTVLTIDNDVVTFAKVQNIATNRILGRTTASSGNIEELTVSNGLTLGSGALKWGGTLDDHISILGGGSFGIELGTSGSKLVYCIVESDDIQLNSSSSISMIAPDNVFIQVGGPGESAEYTLSSSTITSPKIDQYTSTILADTVPVLTFARSPHDGVDFVAESIGFGQELHFINWHPIGGGGAIGIETGIDIVSSNITPGTYASKLLLHGTSLALPVSFLDIDGDIDIRAQFFGPIRLKTYVTGSLPVPSLHPSSITYDSTTNTVKFSNGTTWANISTVPTLQQVLTAGSTLTANNTIAGAGFDLEFDVMGQVIINGDTTTSSTNLDLFNSNGDIISRFRNDGVVVRSNGSSFVGSYQTTNTNFTVSPASDITGDNHVFYNQGNQSGARFQFTGDLMTITGAGSSALLSGFYNLDASSGAHNFTVINLSPTYAFTGSASGILRALDYNPTITSLAGTTHYAITVGSGRSGFGTRTPTALLHLGAGTATASTAPLKLTSGTNNTTAETGAVEYNGTNLFFTRTGTTRETVWCGNDAATAPATNTIGTIADYYGTSATRVLTTPNSWASVVVAGTTYKIPLYT